jgi:hypothetical protein
MSNCKASSTPVDTHSKLNVRDAPSSDCGGVLESGVRISGGGMSLAVEAGRPLDSSPCVL